MEQDKNWTGPKKAEDRAFVWSFIKRTPVKRYLGLLGWNANIKQSSLCVRHGLKVDKMSLEETQIISAERKPSIKPLIEKDIYGLGFRKEPEIYPGDIEDMELDGIIDFAYLDYMGLLDESNLTWIRNQVAPTFDENSIFAITLCYHSRNMNNFNKKVHKQLKKGPYQDLLEYMWQHYGGTFSLSDDDYEFVPFILLKSALNRYSFGLYGFEKYKDGVLPMITYIFGGFKELPDGQTNGYPSIHQLLGGKLIMRKANILAEKRRDAALKAWETRRANAEFEKRSRAAKKAWKTRRSGK